MTDTKTWREKLQTHPAADLFPLLKETDPKALEDLAADIQKNGLRQRLVILREGGTNYLLDGRNRLDAMDHAGLPTQNAIRNATVFEANKKFDPFAYVISVNIHRRHLTAEQKAKLVEQVLKAHSEWSDRQVAKATRASPTTVGSTRRKMEAAGQLSKVDSRVGGDGKTRKQPKHKPAKGSSIVHPTGSPTDPAPSAAPAATAAIDTATAKPDPAVWASAAVPAVSAKPDPAQAVSTALSTIEREIDSVDRDQLAGLRDRAQILVERIDTLLATPAVAEPVAEPEPAATVTEPVVSADKLLEIFMGLKPNTQKCGREWVERGRPADLPVNEHFLVTASLAPFRDEANRLSEDAVKDFLAATTHDVLAATAA